MIRRTWLAGLLLAATTLVPGCQLVDSAADLQPEDDGSGQGSGSDLLGSPEEDFPTTIAQLRAYARPEALTWQDQPVLADLTVWLQPDGTWDRVRVSYVAANADRMLTLRADPDRLRIERPLLEGLQLPELPVEAVEQIAPLPEGALEPVALAEAAADALAGCGATDPNVRAIVYATGAPASWDGTQWSVLPTWEATVVTTTVGVVVDPVSGTPFAPLTCVEPLLLDES